jgi:hypothetical protein
VAFGNKTCKLSLKNCNYKYNNYNRNLAGRSISNYTKAVTGQLKETGNRRSVFSAQSVPRCYKESRLPVGVSASHAALPMVAF